MAGFACHVVSATKTRWARAGGLLSYGPNVNDMVRRAATYVGKILKGNRPTDLPVQEPTRFDPVINLKTAKAFALTVTPTLLAPRRRGDRMRGKG
jgi:putative tryptophan/tyrosine transport system substrate-binding protein